MLLATLQGALPTVDMSRDRVKLLDFRLRASMVNQMRVVECDRQAGREATESGHVLDVLYDRFNVRLE